MILNPIKLKSDEAQDALTLACRKAGWPDPSFYLTEEDDPGYAMTRRALAEQSDLVLAAGGDGTVRAAAETLVGTDTPLGLVPLGTGNLLARTCVTHRNNNKGCAWRPSRREDRGLQDGTDTFFLILSPPSCWG